MATECQNMNTSSLSSSQISSINTYKITKQYYQRNSPAPSNENKVATSNHELDNKNNNNNNLTRVSPSPSPKSINENSSNRTSISNTITSSRTDDTKNDIMPGINHTDLNQQQSNEYAHHQGLKIKTKGIENTLLPLVNQISTLVNFKDSLKFSSNSEKCTGALIGVGKAVNFAVERFVQVGENIAYDNPTIKYDMLVACTEAKESGAMIRNQTSASSKNNIQNLEKVGMIQAANTLLNSVTKVLLLADVVIINQLLNSKNKVVQTLHKLENVIDFWNFVNYFTQYGTDLIDLAHLSGERQNDLKDEKLKSQLSSARWILEKSTAMILSASKAYLKHLECECAKENISLVYAFLQEALDIVHYVAVESGTTYRFTSPVFNSMFKTSPVQISFTNAYRQFEDALDLANNDLLEKENVFMVNTLNALIDSTQDFTDSLYINNDQREKILHLQNDIREQTLMALKLKECQKNLDLSDSSDDKKNDNSSDNQFKSAPILSDCEVLKQLLQTQTMLLANNLFRANEDATLLSLIKTYSASNHYDLLIESLDKFKEYSDSILEVVKLLRHMSTIDVFEVTCEHHYNVFEYLSKMIQSAAGTAALYPQCKSAMENLYLYCESWESQVNDLSILVKEMQDLTSSLLTRSAPGKSNKTVYFSLPRPGKHGTNARVSSLPRGSKLDSNEQAKMAKLGLEMKLITTEIEAEADKWNEPQNEIVKIAKLMSEMAYEIHLFTRGEGSLKTTQDLFAKAQAFLNHGVVLNNIIKDFLVQVPDGYLKEELMQLLNKLPYHFKQLKSRLKQVTIGKTATFNKVDWVIQETRNFMNLVAKLVTSCFLCCSKYNISYENGENHFELNSENLLNKLSLSNNDYVNENKIPMSTYLTNYQPANSNIRCSNSMRADSCGPVPNRAQSANHIDIDS